MSTTINNSKRQARTMGVGKDRIVLFLMALVVFLSTYSTRTRAEGTNLWTLYPSYNHITEIEPAGDMVFVLANGLFSYGVKDGAVVTYDKVKCLSDIDVAHIAWSPSCRRLIIAYSNANIDLMSKDGEVTNVSGLYQWSSTYDKTIHNIYIAGKYAYLSTGFGVVKLNVEDGSIQDSYQLGFSVDHCYIEGEYIYAVAYGGTYRGRLADNLLDKTAWQLCGDFTPVNDDRTNVYDKTTGYWWTTTAEGKLTYYTLDANNERSYKTEGVLPDGPASNHFSRLFLHGGKLYAVAGIYSQEFEGNYAGEVHVWDGANWSEFEQPTAETLGHHNVDWLSMAFDPLKEGHVMVSSKSGLYEFQDGKFVQCFNVEPKEREWHSPLKSVLSDSNPSAKDYLKITDVMYDSEGKLWVPNSDVVHIGSCLWTLDQNYKWEKQPVASRLKYFYDLRNFYVSKTNGKMWFTSNRWAETQLYSYDVANDELTSYGPTYVNEDGANITPYYFYRITEDLEGNVWMATYSGPLYLSADAIKSGSTVFTQHKVPRNDGTNYADYLLADIPIRVIAVDGGNRKWMGTIDNGVYLISADCNTQIYNFTTDNSPLPSNTIQDIVVEPNTGRVYIATDKGLCSFMSDATQPSDQMTKDNVYAYPNPVKPDYTGNVTIMGLTYDADVKIVTSNGVLVNQGRSTGGTYTWNCRDQKGKKVASGIYMVETATSDGSKGTVCKIAVVN